MSLNATDFITAYMEAYNSGLTIDELAVDIGGKANTVVQRVHRYKLKGVTLPPMGRRPLRPGAVKLNADKLNALIDGLTQKETV